MASAASVSKPRLFRLAAELQNMIIEKLETLKDKASFVATCKHAQNITEPYLYRKIYTKIHGSHDTAWLVGFLDRRPELLLMVRFLVLDEYEPVSLHRLLSREFPGLESLVVQHVGEVRDRRTAREKRALRRAFKSQPRLCNLTFRIEHGGIGDKSFYKIDFEDRCIFRHPHLTRIRLSYVDFSCLGDTKPGYLLHQNLWELDIELSDYTEKALTRLILPSKRLCHFRLHHDHGLPFSEALYPRILSCATTTLRRLYLLFKGFEPTDWEGMDFRHFPALNSLTIKPSFLLGRYHSASPPILRDLVRSKLPPNIWCLGFDEITPLQADSSHPGWVEAVGAVAMRQIDNDLISMLMSEKENLAPLLRFIGIYYLETLAEPGSLPVLAKQTGVTYCAFYHTDELSVKGDEIIFIDYNSQVPASRQIRWGTYPPLT